jgi:hypothetical protein
MDAGPGYARSMNYAALTIIDSTVIAAHSETEHKSVGKNRYYLETKVSRVLSAGLRNRKIVFPAMSDSSSIYAESERGTVRSKVSR